MGLEQIQLSGKDILDKEFKTGIRGYNQEEVDQFLDTVIQDYEAFYQEIDRLKQEVTRLKKQGDFAQTQQYSSRTRKATSASQPASSTGTGGQANYDILKRLSNLEKAVFGKKYADE
ncbi:cell division protein GpsB [Pontibacillus halophilus JSM 076056 = DSM 19796]|uniref:Cell cycle protein GpsB n=1 Tax=Pontibacillus halophilus JSM 076056 = DSM 19796 TaxID=1385510 RepID=A0A0A5GLM0_9BACI|nr:cell division regulator GpsB [Pontibacillus halophilus]KGX92123.1 cell division protein GpsB [Pontibacillus halophilus JSM 076056 = DSM 19796]